MILCVCTQTALAFLLLQVAVCNSQSSTCCEGEIRLMNGNRHSNSHEGRVEICYSGQWMTICDDHWETVDAEVVCTQLGYVSEGAQAICHENSAFGEGSGSILDNVDCHGPEPLLINCTLTDYADRYKYCSHSDDAGVRCAPITHNCTEGEIRLANNSTENEGRVEICVNGFWGTMCPNNTSILDANIICKQLGFSEYGATFKPLSGRPLPIRIHDIACTGREVKLIDCPHQKGGISCPGCNSTGVRCSYDTAPAPTGLDIVLDEQNYATITWEPPRLAKRHGKLLNYSVTCSTAQDVSTVMANTLNTTKEIWLEPYGTYQCCVSAVNQAGTGFPSCKLIATNEGAPTAPPTNISWLMLNFSSVLLFWQAPPSERQNGIIRKYCVELSDSNTTVSYTTENSFLLVGNLKPNMNYSCSITAYTIMRGPFSEAIIILLLQEDYISNRDVGGLNMFTSAVSGIKTASVSGIKTTASVSTTKTTNVAESVQSTMETSTLAMYILAVTCGVLVVMMVATAVVFGAAYFHKSYTASSESGDDEIYDTIDELKQSSNSNTKIPPNTLSERKQSMNLVIAEKSIAQKSLDIKRMGSVSESRPNNSNTTEDSNYQPLIPPRKLNQELKYQCLSPTQEGTLGEYVNDNDAAVFNSDMGKDKKDTYQSLIQEEQISSDYQCLTGFTHHDQPSIPVSSPQNI